MSLILTCMVFFAQLGYTALIWAANGGQTDVVKYLVEETTAQVNATNKVRTISESSSVCTYLLHSM